MSLNITAFRRYLPRTVIRKYQVSIGRDYDNYSKQVTENYRPFANPFEYYTRFIDAIRQMRKIRLLPLYELAATRAEETPVLGLRHDIDADPITGLRAARYLARKGICGSFYFLHTAPYYGDFHEGVFIRNPKLQELIQAYIVAGCEIGIHNDAFGLFKFHQTDGCEALVREIAWLRGVGAVIRGAVAHNSAPVYQAENYEVFREKVLWHRRVILDHKIELPIGKLSLKQLDLNYDGTFAKPKQKFDRLKAVRFCEQSDGISIRLREWMYTYLIENPCCDWEMDYQFWMIGKDCWVAAGRFQNQILFEWQVSLDRVLGIISDLPSGTRSVIILHPEYFCLDAGKGAIP